MCVPQHAVTLFLDVCHVNISVLVAASTSQSHDSLATNNYVLPVMRHSVWAILLFTECCHGNGSTHYHWHYAVARYTYCIVICYCECDIAPPVRTPLQQRNQRYMGYVGSGHRGEDRPRSQIFILHWVYSTLAAWMLMAWIVLGLHTICRSAHATPPPPKKKEKKTNRISAKIPRPIVSRRQRIILTYVDVDIQGEYRVCTHPVRKIRN